MEKKKILGTAAALLLGAALYGGGSRAEAAFGTDVVAKSAVSSFEAMLGALPFPAVASEEEGVWVLTSPDGEAAFWWRRDAMEGRHYDAYLCFDAQPFIDAGLDIGKLPESMKGMLEDRGKLMMGTKLSDKPLEYDGEITALSSFEQIVKLDRELVGYHSALDHYGVTVSDGSLFEWAKDMSKNDKDIVFVLNPDAFIAAGVDPTKVQGWTFAKVPVEDERGRKIEADKLLKPFDLK